MLLLVHLSRKFIVSRAEFVQPERQFRLCALQLGHLIHQIPVALFERCIPALDIHQASLEVLDFSSIGRLGRKLGDLAGFRGQFLLEAIPFRDEFLHVLNGGGAAGRLPPSPLQRLPGDFQLFLEPANGFPGIAQVVRQPVAALDQFFFR